MKVNFIAKVESREPPSLYRWDVLFPEKFSEPSDNATFSLSEPVVFKTSERPKDQDGNVIDFPWETKLRLRAKSQDSTQLFEESEEESQRQR